jgi:hypothetical protein
VTLETTLGLLLASLLAVAAGLLGDWARRRAPLAWHAHLPWNGLVFTGLTLAIFSAVHLLGLWQAAV